MSSLAMNEGFPAEAGIVLVAVAGVEVEPHVLAGLVVCARAPAVGVPGRERVAVVDHGGQVEQLPARG